MKKLTTIFLFLIWIFSSAQSLTRDPNYTREEANKEWNGNYTLYDFWNDNPILPDEKGIYKFYYDLTPKYIITDTKIYEVFSIDKPESVRGTIEEIKELGLSEFCKFESYWTWEKWKNSSVPVSPIHPNAQEFAPKIIEQFNTASKQIIFYMSDVDSKNKCIGYKEMLIMNDGTNNVNIKTYGAQGNLTNEFNGKWKIFQMLNFSCIKITFDQNSINKGTDLCLSYEILMNKAKPVALKDLNSGLWSLKGEYEFTPGISESTKDSGIKFGHENSTIKVQSNTNQSDSTTENKSSEKIQNKSKEPIFKPVSIEHLDISSLSSNVYKLYLQEGKKSLKYEWFNSNSATPNPTQPKDLLPTGKNYFEVRFQEKLSYSNGSPELYYILHYKLPDNYRELPQSERYSITEFSTDSNLLKQGKFKIALCYVYPPKSKWRTKVFYVYCDELKNDLTQLGIK